MLDRLVIMYVSMGASLAIVVWSFVNVVAGLLAGVCARISIRNFVAHGRLARMWSMIWLVVGIVGFAGFWQVYSSSLFRMERAIASMHMLDSCKRLRSVDTGAGVLMSEFVCSRSCKELRDEFLSSKLAHTADPREDSLSLKASLGIEGAVISMVERGAEGCVVIVNVSESYLEGDSRR